MDCLDYIQLRFLVSLNAGSEYRIHSLELKARSFMQDRGCVRHCRMQSIRDGRLVRRCLSLLVDDVVSPFHVVELGSQITFLQRAEGGLFLSCKERDRRRHSCSWITPHVQEALILYP